MNLHIKYLAIDSWAGRRYYPVTVLSETAKKAKVRILAPGVILLPGRRYALQNDVISVPKSSLREMEK